MSKKKAEYHSDAEVWNDFRNGSEEAYSFIYEEYASVLFTYGCGVHPDRELVKDCLQDLFVCLWRTRTSLSPTNSIRFYLFRCLRREIARKLKAFKASKKPESELVESSFEEAWIVWEEASYKYNVLKNALKLLSERQREAVYLRFYQNMEFDVIAQVMDITPRAVYKLVYRAIDVLQKSYFSSCPSRSSRAPKLSLAYPKLSFFALLLIAALSISF